MEGRASDHLDVLEEIERDGLPGLVEVLLQEGLDAVRYVLWDITGWDRDYGFLLALRSDVSEEQKRVGWEMFVFIEKILVTVLHEGLKRQAGETMDALSDGPEGFYGRYMHRHSLIIQRILFALLRLAERAKRKDE